MLRRPLLACLFAALSPAATAAPTPKLESAAPILCTASADDKARWVPTAAQVAALEKALPAYFAASKAHASELPAGKHVYARQYSGITRNGKRLIWGSFYPVKASMLPGMKPGSCWAVSDGGNAFWNVTFDLQTGKIIDLGVNGVA